MTRLEPGTATPHTREEADGIPDRDWMEMRGQRVDIVWHDQIVDHGIIDAVFADGALFGLR